LEFELRPFPVDGHVPLDLGHLRRSPLAVLFGSIGARAVSDQSAWVCKCHYLSPTRIQRPDRLARSRPDGLFRTALPSTTSFDSRDDAGNLVARLPSWITS